MILRDFGAKENLPELVGSQTWDFPDGWDLGAALAARGLSSSDRERIQSKLRAFWDAHFFTASACEHDIEILGAPRYVSALAATGVQIAYLTGRPENMRPGTERCLTKCGFPPSPQRARLFMKPSASVDDQAFKRSQHAMLRKLGEVIAVFENEPRHVNDFADAFPGATILHLATDHSGRPVTVSAGVASIPDFAD